MTLKFAEKAHRYTLDGRPAPGVTTLIGKGLPKPAIPRWAAKSVAEWVADNPTFAEDIKRLGGRGPAVAYMSQIPWQKRDDAAVRGTEVHALAERIVHGETVEVPDHLAGYVEGYVTWLDSTDLVPIATERPIANRQWWYAGTFDLIATMGGETWLLDVKTGKGVYGEYALQLAAYANADFMLSQDRTTEEEMPVIDRIGVLHVTEYGTSLHAAAPGVLNEAWKTFQHVAWVAKRVPQIEEYLPREGKTA